MGLLSYTRRQASMVVLSNRVGNPEHSSTTQDLKKAGLKVTLPRVSILEILERAEQHHLSAEDVYKTLLDQGRDVGLATVYRVLTQFEVTITTISYASKVAKSLNLKTSELKNA